MYPLIVNSKLNCYADLVSNVYFKILPKFYLFKYDKESVRTETKGIKSFYLNLDN